ncbi:MAG: heme ABC exporter ATP-binding protein CcmA [Pseudomonadota bacterium]
MRRLIEATDLGYRRNGEPVFEAVDLALEAGTALVIQGDNGAGKTTLLRLLAGILTPGGGRIERTEEPMFLGHAPAVKTDLTCRENLRYEQQLGRSSTAIASALIQVGLAGMGARPARTLSAGQTRRLGLARLLVRRSKLWLLDEPYASLDVQGCRQVDQLIHQHLSSGGGAILSTHLQQPRLEYPVSTLTVIGALRQSSLRSDEDA